MRFLGTVIAAAVLIFLVYLFVGFLVDGYFGGNIIPDRATPESWSAPDTWAEWRDILMVFTFFFWLLAGLVLTIVFVVLVVLLFMVRRILKEHAVPALDSLKGSLDNVRGTTEFAGETVASPIIRTYAVVKGVRAGLGAITNLPGRIKGRKKKGRK
jgi:membrane-associated phospholipid phosphatase